MNAAEQIDWTLLAIVLSFFALLPPAATTSRLPSHFTCNLVRQLRNQSLLSGN
jgi:hypothetical protein